jgi:hypothetical protein
MYCIKATINHALNIQSIMASGNLTCCQVFMLKWLYSCFFSQENTSLFRKFPLTVKQSYLVTTKDQKAKEWQKYN